MTDDEIKDPKDRHEADQVKAGEDTGPDGGRTVDVDVDDTEALKARDRAENHRLFTRMRIPVMLIGLGLLTGALSQAFPRSLPNARAIVELAGGLCLLGGILWMVILITVDSIRRLVRLRREFRIIWARELAKLIPGTRDDDAEAPEDGDPHAGAGKR